LKLKLIDFERSVDAPIDFELDTISKVVNYPEDWDVRVEKDSAKARDYENVLLYIKKYYPDIMDVDNLNLRLAAYDVRDYIRFCDKFPELKNRVLKRCCEILESNDYSERG
jgi:hypothetical protein